MCEQHLDLLSELHRDFILAGLGDITGDLAGIFVFFTGDLARVGVGAAIGFRWARLADLFQSPTARRSFSGRPSVRVFEKVEWSGTRSFKSRRQNHRYARFRCTSSQSRRSDRMPKQYPTSSIRISSSGSTEGRPVWL